ncbi:hypothetical protein RclHR1_13550013 [Rhizophagus clarus]|uniref:Uncharacterized protein n=1 Tax=Rhizophagus clarus TaxID=94130 RepID=A0A2Z6QC60_9GLOM|nr:hypothetical protein RclHR1_13550013 [Rhizophagus clarus]GES83180.1 hypothetical protein GLOIN_2v1768311 [Rhizophagus clarus]
MENIHTIWDSSTIGKGKKLVVAIDNGLYLLDKCTELHNTCNKLTKENTQLRNRLDQSVILSKNISKELKQLLADTKNVLNLEQQLAFDKQYIQSLTVELEQLKTQYFNIQSTASAETVLRAEYEANLITNKKEIDVPRLRLKELESALSTKITEIHSLETELSSKTMELQKCEAELSSKLFELQTAKTKCGVYKQHVSDMAEQSSLKKYQTLIPLPDKQNKEMLD